MTYLFITLVVGLILSAWVVLDALRPKTSDGAFTAPRRKEPNRVWDTIRSEKIRSEKIRSESSAKTEMSSLKQPDQKN
jgi:hypothetical protein